jgi:hypothetical protein
MSLNFVQVSANRVTLLRECVMHRSIHKLSPEIVDQSRGQLLGQHLPANYSQVMETHVVDASS